MRNDEHFLYHTCLIINKIDYMCDSVSRIRVSVFTVDTLFAIDKVSSVGN